MALAGKRFLVQVSTASGGVYTSIGQMNNGTMSIAATNFDVTAFGSSWLARLQGLKDVTYQFSGFFMTTDTNGQTAVRTSLINDSALFIRCLVDGTTGNMFQQEVKISAYDISAAVDGAVELSISAEGTDAITVYTTS